MSVIPHATGDSANLWRPIRSRNGTDGRDAAVDKSHATKRDVAPVRTAMDLAHNIPASSVDPPATIADPDDIPVIACAIAAGANIFVTGD